MRPTASSRLVHQQKPRTCGACYQTGRDKLGTIDVHCHPVWNPGCGFTLYYLEFRNAQEGDILSSFPTMPELTWQHQWNAHWVGHGAKQMVCDASNSPGQACT